MLRQRVRARLSHRGTLTKTLTIKGWEFIRQEALRHGGFEESGDSSDLGTVLS